MIKQIASITVFHHKVDIFLVLAMFDKFDHMLRVDLLKTFDFSLEKAA